MNNFNQSQRILEKTFGAHLLVDDYDPDSLVEWCRKNFPDQERGRQFKEELRAAIIYPGKITPQTYESWTADDSFDTQQKIQSHLEEIWEACFPEDKW